MDFVRYFFIFHITSVLILAVLKVFKIVKCDYIHLLVAFLIPVWGPLMLILSRVNIYHTTRREIDESLRGMHVGDEVMQSIYVDERKNEVVPLNEALIMNNSNQRYEIMKDILYDVNSSINADDDEVIEKVVPISEALVLNDAATRRTLIMDVLYSNPSDYVSQLNEAKQNDDTEVVHYAVTALVELQKEFDMKFQSIFKRRELNPDDPLLDKEYRKLLERYISSGLLEGEGLHTQLINYRELLLKAIDNGERSWTIQCKLADTNLRLKDAEELKKDVEKMYKSWPDRETTYLYRIKLGILTKDKEAVYKVINEIEGKEMYLSSELRNLIDFWREENA